jgi:three-Cys-motif partner protein
VFAGSGVNLIGEHMTPLAGSSPIATRFHYKSQPFDRFYALEINPAYCSALQERMTKFVPQNAFKIMRGDADKNIGKAIEDLEKRRLHYLAFIDYEGMKGFSWESLEKLLQHNGDLWITFICPGFARVQGRARWSDADSVTLEKALSPEVVRKSNDVWELADNFVARIRDYRPKVVEMDVRSGDGYYYRLIYATRQTRGGSSYISSVEALKKRVESVSGKFVQLVVDVLENRRKDMDSFM